ncbi:hypothetical protein I4U23_003308 [Adineta vaga]|nr:hypothetical protein I4U23_003308 [Adineta vaga]
MTDFSLFDTYLVYALIGTLIFIAFIGVLVLLAVSYCCLYSYFCCYRRHRHSSYRLNDKVHHERDNRENKSCLQLYETYPYLVNQYPLKNHNINTSYTTINTIGNASLVRTSSSQSDYVKTTNHHYEVSRWSTPFNESCSTVDIDSNDARLSPCANIYETVVPITNFSCSVDRTTPIYETEWTHNLKQLIMPRKPSFEVVPISTISCGLVPDTHYFPQQQQHPYDKVLSARAKASDSMRRNKMLKRLRDDAAFLY